MTNLTKIFRLLLVAVFCCLYSAKVLSAAETVKEGEFELRKILSQQKTESISEADKAKNAHLEGQGYTKKTTYQGKTYYSNGSDWSYLNDSFSLVQIQREPVTPISNNKKAAVSDVTGCSADYGLFSGLITTGGKIFNGLRELIYVVAGFGIIGVSVGGFFGNLNYKWLGAIVISLVVIATTGELINAITGCKTFTTSVIQDTLK